MRIPLLLLSFFLYSTSIIAQNIAMSNGTFEACGGTFTDDGVGGAYTNTDYTITICPDQPGQVILLEFSAFALQTSPGNNQSDYIEIFNGPDTDAPSLGTYGGNSLQGFQVTGNSDNTSGCLTIFFNTLGPANAGSPGWEASVSCTIPCEAPSGASAIVSPSPSNGGQSVSVCLNETITFNSIGSSAAQGFNIANYIWNFDDGTVLETLDQTVSHSFAEPGEYIVTMTVQDDNGCFSTNVQPLQVLVSTIPLFPGMEDFTTCFPEPVELVGNAISTLWTALPPQVVAGETYLADGAGFSYTTSLTFDIFEPGAVLETCDDLLGITVNMEHSFMGDLGLSITCPDGTEVDLVEWGVNGGGGTFLGEAIDNDPGTDPGIGYTYTWDPDATNGTWGDNAGFGGPPSLPAGSYEAQGNLCDLVGCPLNGSWTFTVTDNLAADNGYIFWWGVDLNPALFPDVTTFQPSIGIGADSSYWTGPFITSSDINLDTLYLVPPAAGSYDYQYNVINSFGCQFDTTITVTWEETLPITAGPDQLFVCDPVELQGGFEGLPTPACAQDGGVFTYCYTDNDNLTWTFCPDDPGDGTVMTFTFLSGQVENFFDNITVFDGSDTGAPFLGTATGMLDGLSWTATNPDGCLTITFTSDGSVSCDGGSFTEWQYEVTCGNGGPLYTWEWTPAEFLDNPSSPTPLAEVTQSTVFTLTAYPVGQPDCGVSDDVVVNIDPSASPGIDTDLFYCINGPAFETIDELDGNPAGGGTWTDPLGAPFSGTFTPGVDAPGAYTYSVGNPGCLLSSVLTLSESTTQIITVPNDTSLCAGGAINLDLLSIDNGVEPFTYRWRYNGTLVSSAANADYVPGISGVACLEVIDQCGVTVEDCFNVLVEQPITVSFSVDTTRACFPHTFTFNNDTPLGTFVNSEWTLGDNTTFFNQNNFDHNYAAPGFYDVSLKLTSAIGCQYELTEEGYISLYDSPEAQWYATPQPTNIENTEITFNDISNGQIISHVWEFNYTDMLGESLEQNPVFEFPGGQGGVYPVRLTITDSNGCTDIYTQDVVINDILTYYIPTSFTPNNDGINDVWKVYGVDIDPANFKLQVFNRWGEVVFETLDPEGFWLGETNDGDYYSQNGIYFWRAKITSIATGERYELEGHLYLMK